MTSTLLFFCQKLTLHFSLSCFISWARLNTILAVFPLYLELIFIKNIFIKWYLHYIFFVFKLNSHRFNLIFLLSWFFYKWQSELPFVIGQAHRVNMTVFHTDSIPVQSRTLFKNYHTLNLGWPIHFSTFYFLIFMLMQVTPYWCKSPHVQHFYPLVSRSGYALVPWSRYHFTVPRSGY